MVFRCENISKSYGAVQALADVSLDARPGELVSVIGPSGAGKTTLLHILAGLERPDAGRLTFARPPSRQDPVILVFQDYLLFPNMTVAENVAFGLRARRLPKAEIAGRVAHMLEFFQIADKAGRFPADLSAGERQRAAIARALAVTPRLLLLDEPFANLDPNLKMETAAFIRSVQQRFQIAVVAVTHDLQEAFVMSDRIGVLLRGRLTRLAPPEELGRDPGDPETAAFLGLVNSLPASFFDPRALDPDAVLHVRPEALVLEKRPDGLARVLSRAYSGQFFIYRLRLGDRECVAHSFSGDLAPGDLVRPSLTARLNLARRPA